MRHRKNILDVNNFWQKLFVDNKVHIFFAKLLFQSYRFFTWRWINSCTLSLCDYIDWWLNSRLEAAAPHLIVQRIIASMWCYLQTMRVLWWATIFMLTRVIYQYYPHHIDFILIYRHILLIPPQLVNVLLHFIKKEYYQLIHCVRLAISNSFYCFPWISYHI